MFDLSVSIATSQLEIFKRRLEVFFPAIPSCHRVESLARALGSRNYNALLERINSDPTSFEICDLDAFKMYLSDKGYEVEVEKPFVALASYAICCVMEKIPRLTWHGMGIGPSRDGRETASQHDARFRDAREGMRSEPFAAEFLRSLTLIRRIVPIKTINPRTSSYKLKHIAENLKCVYPTGRRLGPHYVSNGAFIAAAVHSGYRHREYHGSFNTTFNMSERCIDDLDCEIRPNGALAQERERIARRRELAKRYGLPISRISF